MINLVSFLCFFVLCWAHNYDAPIKVTDSEFYWREYFLKEVPSDALPGGYDKNGNVTYVGLVVHPEGKGLIPATIYPGEYAIAQVSFQGKSKPAFIHRKNIQILCSSNHSCYEWVKINIDGFYKVPGTAVRAGNEWDWDMYVGRANYSEELSIGRVYRPETAYKGLWLTGRDRGEYKHLQDFELLVFSNECNELIANTSGANNYDSPISDTEFYWKEYFLNDVPIDALPGGYDKKGNVTYIGLVAHPESRGLIPATIYPGEYAITQVYFQGRTSAAFIHRKNIQILCSRHHSCYKWVQINIDDFYKVPGTAVRAGNEWDWDMYIGRANYSDELSIGRVYRPDTAYKGLWLTGRDKGEYKHLQDFELLMYSDECNKLR